MSVLLEGRPVARSDASGLAFVALDSRPEAEVTFSPGDWHGDVGDDRGWGELFLEGE